MFGPQAQELLQHRVVDRPGAVEELHDQGTAGIGVQGEREERDHIGIVGGDRGAAIGVDRVGVDVVLREAGQLVRGHRDAADVVADVLAELLVDDQLAIAQLSQSRPGRLVLVHPCPAEVAKGQAQDPSRSVVQTSGVGCGEDLEEVAVQAQVGRELVALLLGGLGLRAQGLLRVDLTDQGRSGHRVVQGDRHLVPVGQQPNGVRGRRVLDGPDQSMRPRQLGPTSFAQPVTPAIGRAGHGQRRQCGSHHRSTITVPRGRGWHRGQKYDERFMNASRLMRVPQRRQGRPSRP
jgi:hypothetical protein